MNRFWTKVAKGTDDECWEWTATRSPQGYGMFSVDGVARGAHRCAWALTYGDPGSLYVCHRCDNRACCNPSHLFLGTQSDNLQDMISKGRQVTAAKLTIARAESIRRLYAKGSFTYEDLARVYGVSKSTVRHTVQGRRWKQAL